MGQVKLSVCIPVYNCEQFIGAAIESVLMQDYNDYELLIIDNCSTDSTVQVIKSFADPRIRLLQNETNIGMLGNWNKAVQEANGQYIKMLPADDYISQGCLSSQCAVLDQDSSKAIALVCGRKDIITDKGKKLFARGFSKKTEQVSGKEAINRTVRSGGNILGEPGVVMFRKEIIEKTGPFVADIFYVLDLSMWFKMLLHGDLYSQPNVVAAFRISTVSESIRLINKQKNNVDTFFKRIYEDKNYGLTLINFRIGLLNSFISSIAKRIIYKFVL